MPDTVLDRLTREQQETWRQMQALMERADSEGRSLTAEESANWDAANQRLDQIEAETARRNRMADLERIDRSQIVETGGQPHSTETDVRDADAESREYRNAFANYMRRGIGNISSEHRALLEAHHTELDNRAQGQATQAAGGFLVPPEFRQQIAETIKAYGGILQFANVITTDTGANLSWPTNDDTGNEGVILAENTQVAEQDVTFGQRQIGAYTYTSKMIRVPWTLLNDTAFDLESFLARKFGERIGRIWSKHLVSGTGTGQPTGVLTGLRVGTTTAVGATPVITYDALVDVEHSIDPAYRNSGNCRFGLGDDVLRMIRKLKDADGRPLWVPVPVPGFPPQINGHPYFVDNSMAAAAPAGVAAIFGDFRAGMLVRQVQGIQSVRLGERYADFLQTGYFAFARMDAKPDDPQALAALKFGAAA